MTKKLVALIPARGGSRSIPLKNIRLFLGRPLIHWVIDAALKSQSISEVVVATDSDEITRACEERDPSASGLRMTEPDPRMTIFRRSTESATDEAPTESVMLEFARGIKNFDDLILIQATSPWLKSSDIDQAYALFKSANADSLVSVTKQKFFMWKKNVDGAAEPLNYDPQQRPRRQEWEGELVENGAFYITKRDKLIQSQCRISGKIVVFEMDLSYPVELDEPRDWKLLEGLMGGDPSLRSG